MHHIDPPDTILLDCATCDAAVNAVCVSAYEHYDSLQQTPIRYYYCRCPACHAPMVAVSENWLNTKREADWDVPSRLLPNRIGCPIPTQSPSQVHLVRLYSASAAKLTPQLP